MVKSWWRKLRLWVAEKVCPDGIEFVWIADERVARGELDTAYSLMERSGHIANGKRQNYRAWKRMRRLLANALALLLEARRVT